MASSTYLELCQELVAEVGAGGGIGPSSVTGQTGEFRNIVRWIARADTYVQSLWQDWKFLWREYQTTVAAGSNAPIPPATVARWKIRGDAGQSSAFFLDRALDTYTTLQYVPWERFRGVHDVGAITAGRPEYITIKPDNTLQFERPTDAEYTLTGEYWTSPTKLTANTDRTAIPEQFERIIIARAGIFYGNREDAPELIAGYEAEYMDFLEKLESSQLPGQEHRRKSADDEILVVEIPS